MQYFPLHRRRRSCQSVQLGGNITNAYNKWNEMKCNWIEIRHKERIMKVCRWAESMMRKEPHFYAHTKQVNRNMHRPLIITKCIQRLHWQGTLHEVRSSPQFIRRTLVQYAVSCVWMCVCVCVALSVTLFLFLSLLVCISCKICKFIFPFHCLLACFSTMYCRAAIKTIIRRDFIAISYDLP